MTGSTRTDGARLGGRYELVHHIARGGMGDVFEAFDHQLGRQVAVKRFRGSSPQDAPRFATEVLALARLNHPNLVQVYDAGEHDGLGYLVMELVDGPSLQSILQTRVSLPAEEVASLGVALADALDYVHHQGIVHRDVAPANVLCGADGRPRLADFGIARLIDTSRITAVETTIGTAAYMAPEQLEGHDVTPAADVYALGLVLLEALAGRPGFEGTSSEVAVARLVRDPDTTTGVDEGWSDLLGKMTARDPQSRPSAGRARDMIAGLAPLRAAPDGGAALLAGFAALPAARPAPAGSAVDPLASTQALPLPAEPDGAIPGGGTALMPVAAPPSTTAKRSAAPRQATSKQARGRQLAWIMLAGLVLALLMGLASRSGDGVPSPTSVSVEPAPTATTSPTTAAPAPPPPPAPPSTDDEDDEGEGDQGNRGKGQDKQKRDDD